MDIMEKLKTEKAFRNEIINEICISITSKNFDYEKFINDKINETESAFKEYLELYFRPFSIKEVVTIIVTKSINNDTEFLHSKIIYKFMELLYSGKIGYCIRGRLDCEVGRSLGMDDVIHGDNLKFVKIYLKYMTDDDIAKCREFIDKSKKGDIK